MHRDQHGRPLCHHVLVHSMTQGRPRVQDDTVKSMSTLSQPCTDTKNSRKRKACGHSANTSPSDITLLETPLAAEDGDSRAHQTALRGMFPHLRPSAVYHPVYKILPLSNGQCVQFVHLNKGQIPVWTLYLCNNKEKIEKSNQMAC